MIHGLPPSSIVLVVDEINGTPVVLYVTGEAVNEEPNAAIIET